MRGFLILISLLLTICTSSSPIGATTPPNQNFSGVWMLDKTRIRGSFASDVETMRMVVTQDDNKVAVETHIVNMKGEGLPIQNVSYVLNGIETVKETSTQLPLVGTFTTRNTWKATWLDQGLSMEFITSFSTTMGKRASTATSIREVWSILDTPQRLYIERKTTSNGTSTNDSLVFNREKQQ